MTSRAGILPAEVNVEMRKTIAIIVGARPQFIKIMPLMGQLSSNVDPLQFYGGLVGAGFLLGAMSSIVSIRRYLRV